MRKLISEEEKRLAEIFEPYFDWRTGELVKNAPVEAVEALRRMREIGKKERKLENL